jgi:signal transduction histidine kinase
MLDRLEEAFTEREQSEERLRRFVADASHELRTPLASIRGYAELHRMGAATDEAAVTRAMQRIEDEATRMGVLVEDLLTLARLDEVAGAPHADVDLAALAADAVDDALWQAFTARRLERTRTVVDASVQLGQWLLDHEQGDMPGLMGRVAALVGTRA